MYQDKTILNMQLLDYNNILLYSSLFFISLSTSLLVYIQTVMYCIKKTETKVLEKDTDIYTKESQQPYSEESYSEESYSEESDDKESDDKESEGEESDDKESEGEESDDKESDDKESEGGESEGEESDDKESEGEESEGGESEGGESEGGESDKNDILLFISNEFNKLEGLKLYVSVEDLPSDQCIRIVDKHSMDHIFKYILEKRKIR